MSQRPSALWTLLLGTAPGARVLEVGADRGDRAEALRAAGAVVTCVRRREEEARALRERGFEVRVGPAGLDAGPFDALVVSVAAGPSGDARWGTDDLADLLRSLAAPVKPGGAVLVALPNPLYDAPAVGWLLARVLGTLGPRSAGSTKATAFRFLRVRTLHRLLRAAGLTEISVFAAIPGGAQPKFLVPLEDPAVVRYFVKTFVPRAGSAARRTLVRIGTLAAMLGLFEGIVPAYEIAARKALPA